MPEERLLCPVRAICLYLDATSSLTLRPCLLFVSLRGLCLRLLCRIVLRQVISDAGAVWDMSAGAPKAHTVRGVSTSAAFMWNWLVSKVLEAATWRSNPVLASFYFKDLLFQLDN